MGVVGKHYDDHKNLLKRQVVAAEYIRMLKYQDKRSLTSMKV